MMAKYKADSRYLYFSDLILKRIFFSGKIAHVYCRKKLLIDYQKYA